jgi:quinol monooxygenase YgiN
MEKINILVRGRIHEGKQAEFAATVAEGMAKVKAEEPGTERWEFYISPDGREVVTFESYRDSNAMLAHLANLGETIGKLMSLTDVTIEMFGSPSPELAQATAPFVKSVYPEMQGIPA